MQENFQRQLSELKKEVEEAFSSSKLGLDSKEALYSLKSILIEENIKDSEIT